MLEEFRIWVRLREWRLARRMLWCRHQYTLCKPDADPIERAAFEHFVRLIREHGVKERFEGNRYTKLELGGFKFWSMGWPVHQTILINRAHVDWPVLPRPPKPEKKPKKVLRRVVENPSPIEGVHAMSSWIEHAPRHPRYGYPQLTETLALTLTPAEIDALPPAQKGYARRARRQADLVAGGMVIEAKSSRAPVAAPEAVKAKRKTKTVKPKKRRG